MGQAQAPSGIVLDLSGLKTVHNISTDHVVVDAGTTWAALLTATLGRGLAPRVLTDYLGTSVGGTLSVGGIGGTTHRYGVQTDNVLSLDVVTGDGVLRTCSPTESPDLFNAVLAGFGRCGIIVRATIPLVAAPARARRIKVYYPTAAELRAQQRKLLRERRFDFLQGQILPSDTGWVHMLDFATFYTPPAEPDEVALLDGIGFDATRDKIEDLSYWEFATRLDETVTYLETTGEWRAPHPWPNLFLPDRTTDAFVDKIMHGLTHADLGASGLILTYPVPSDVFTTPLFRVPDAPTVFLVAALRFASTEAIAEQMVESNRRWYDIAVNLSGTSYPVGAIPFTEDDWRNHLGEAHQPLAEAAARYDPREVLNRRLKLTP
ncbi:FAD-binding protein [Amycolatopsis circi]|uniref:FAD-binding protein n=1 Tax=Amycolatopsis circi TaxID=871959 RepID=UPI0013BE941E|nr:FAD-binding protein [Amycolatopsis circi]